MSLTTGQVAVSGTVAVLTVPSGAGALVLTTTSGTAYVGPGSSVTTSNGFPITSTPFKVPTFADSAGTKLYGTVTSGTVTVSYFLSTAA